MFIFHNKNNIPGLLWIQVNIFMFPTRNVNDIDNISFFLIDPYNLWGEWKSHTSFPCSSDPHTCKTQRGESRARSDIESWRAADLPVF